jgi:hypothetical protein
MFWISHNEKGERPAAASLCTATEGAATDDARDDASALAVQLTSPQALPAPALLAPLEMHESRGDAAIEPASLSASSFECDEGRDKGFSGKRDMETTVSGATGTSEAKARTESWLGVRLVIWGEAEGEAEAEAEANEESEEEVEAVASPDEELEAVKVVSAVAAEAGSRVPPTEALVDAGPQNEPLPPPHELVSHDDGQGICSMERECSFMSATRGVSRETNEPSRDTTVGARS